LYKLLKLMTEGSADPTQRIPVLAKLASSPRAGMPTLSCVELLISAAGTPLMEITA
jgi:hypothetical protein